jgi:hypothetical protein
VTLPPGRARLVIKPVLTGSVATANTIGMTDVACCAATTAPPTVCEWHVGEKTIRATPGTYLFIPPGVPHNITNDSEKPARVLMTVSPPGHEDYFEELAKLAAQGAPDPKALADLRNRYDTDQLSTLTTRA